MRIAFTHQLQLPGTAPEPGFDRPETIQAITEALRRLGHEVETIEVSGPVSRVVARLEAIGPDLAFNTAARRALFLPALFERMELPFAGSGPVAWAFAREPERARRWIEASSPGAAGPPPAPGARVVLVPYLGRDVLGPVSEGDFAPAGLAPEAQEAALGVARAAVRALELRDFAAVRIAVAGDKASFQAAEVLPPLAVLTGGGVALDRALEVIVAGAAQRHGLSPSARPRARKGVRVGFTYNLKRVASSPGGEVDSDAEYDSPKVIAAVREAIESYGHEVVELEATPELPSLIGSAGVDVVFNMAEGIRGRNREAQIPAILELLDIPYSGSDAATMSLALDKALAKRVVAQAGFATAPFVQMTTGKERLPKDFRFPAIVKPVAEGSSKGVLATSVVENEAELRELARTIAGKYRQAALVETYLSGREFTVALLGEKKPRVLPPMEIVFINPERKHPVYAFSHKLDWSNELRYDRPAKVDAALGKELERVARGVFAALGCRDLARVDLRLDAEGRVNFIEVNPLPGLSPGWSDLCLIAESAGMDYRTLIGEILAPALRRHRERTISRKSSLRAPLVLPE